MAVTAASFRTDFPEFANTTDYPNTLINFYLALGPKLIDATRWGDIFDFGLSLFVAHNIVLERVAAKAVIPGGIPGLTSGPMASKQVDKVSVSYDTTAAIEPGAGHWNLTTYGQRYIRLVGQVGAGPLQF